VKRLEDGRLLRTVVAGAGACAFVTVAVALTGGVFFHIATLDIRARNLGTPLALAVVFTLVAFTLSSRLALRDTLAWWWGALERRAAAIALLLAARRSASESHGAPSPREAPTLIAT
jgi:hypothetical protein